MGCLAFDTIGLHANSMLLGSCVNPNVIMSMLGDRLDVPRVLKALLIVCSRFQYNESMLEEE